MSQFQTKPGHLKKVLPLASYHRTFSTEQAPKPLPPPQPHPTVIQRLSRIEDSLRFHGYSLLRVGLLIIMIGGRYKI